MGSFFTWKRTRGLGLGLLVAVMATAEISAMSLRELRALAKTEKQGENFANYYLVGVMEGVLEAHAQAVRKGANATICQIGRRLQPRMAREIFDAELKRNSGVYEADMSVQLVMANALATVYPC